MKIGLILECTQGGADQQVYSCWIAAWLPGARVEPSCAGNKQRLIAEAGLRAKALLAEGCERVMIVWDLWPAWRARKGKPDAAADIAGIEAALRAAGVAHPCVYLICIDRMLETLLVVDGGAIRLTLNLPRRIPGPRNQKAPRKIVDPKDYLSAHFKKASGRPYTDYVHAVQIAKNADPTRLRIACPEFAQLEQAASQTPCSPPLAWQP